VLGYGEIIIAEFSDIDTSTPLDVSVSLNDSTTPPSLTTTRNFDLIVVGASGNPSAQTATSPEAMLGSAYAFSDGLGTNASYVTQGVAGAFTTSMTNIPANTAAWVVAAFRSYSLTSSFDLKADPVAKASGTGGVARAFSSVLGSIQLGAFQLGQVPSPVFISGVGAFSGRFHPTAKAVRNRALMGSMAATAYPTAKATGNKGPLLIAFAFVPQAAAQGIFYYADGAFTCSPDPTATAQGVRAGGVVFTAFPVVTAAPLAGQQVSCVVGPNPPDGELSNYVF
jgi:hypothetical protein